MKIRIASLALFLFSVSLALPAIDSTIYENGPIDGQDDAWPINFDSWVADSFTVSGAARTFTALSFGAWLYPGDILTSVEVLVTSNRDGGTIYFDQTVAFSAPSCFTNQYGYSICNETGNFNGPTLSDGTYWLRLQDANSSSGDEVVWWDENSGAGCHSLGCPSQAWESEEGPVPSESFSLSGSGSTTPEPNSIMLFGSGIAGAALLRRRIAE